MYEELIWDDDLHFLCSVLQSLSREKHLTLTETVTILGENTLRRLYLEAPILHCEDIVNTVGRLIDKHKIEEGKFYNYLSKEEFITRKLPAPIHLASNYVEMIIRIKPKDKIEELVKIYKSLIGERVEDFRTDIYRLPIDYLVECYRQGKQLDY